MEYEKYKKALQEFLELIEGQGRPIAESASSLRYPAFEFSALLGSAEGRDLWESSAAANLIGLLLEDPNLKSWFSPERGGPNPASQLQEMRGLIASFVGGWAMTQLDAAQMVARHGSLLLECLREPRSAHSKIQVLYGVSIEERLELPTSVNLEPATSEKVQEVLSSWGVSTSDLFRVPRAPAIIVTTSAIASRQDFPAFAATSAWAGAEVAILHVREDIFLATGIYPRLGDGHTLDHSAIPIYPGERQVASRREMFPGSVPPSTVLDGKLFREIHLRMDAVRRWPASFTSEHLGALWVASAYCHSFMPIGDPLISLMLTHTAVESLLLERGHAKSRIGPRLALLIQKDPEEGRKLRRIVQAWTEIRDAAAHGERPADGLLGPFIGQDVSAEPSPFRAGDQTLWGVAQRRGEILYRRVFWALLYSLADLLDDGSPRPTRTRETVISLLERAAAGNEEARDELEAIVPRSAREMGL